MDAALLAPADWAALTSSLPRIAALGGLALAAGLALALLLTFLFGDGDEPDARPSRLGASKVLVSSSGPSIGAPARLESALVAAGARPATVARDPLRGAGFSPTDVIALSALRQRVQVGEVAEGPTRSERLAFACWLVQHGRLAG